MENGQQINDTLLQKPNVYNQYSPFHEPIARNASLSFDEIRENLSSTIQQGELEPGFLVWSKELRQFISLYGFHFNKNDHLKLVHLYLSVLSITDLDYVVVEACFDTLYDLLRKTRLITREELVIDWRIFYFWGQLIYNNHDKDHSLVILPKNADISLYICARQCSPYFSITATQEILDELRPKMCPMDWSFVHISKMFRLLLPVMLPPDLHERGFRLWLSEFYNIWQNIYNGTVWESRLIDLFSILAWNNIGYIDWEPWMSQIFTRILRGFSLPVGKTQMVFTRNTYYVADSAKWIIAMINKNGTSLQYLRDLLVSIKTFYHPSNTGTFQKDLVRFVSKLAEYFVDRLHLERRVHAVWFYVPLESSRLTEQDITDFVDCLKEYAFIAIFNKDHADEAVEACRYLSILRPDLIVPSIVEKHFSSAVSLAEPHRTIAILNCLKHIVPQMVRQTATYSQGQTYVLPIIMSLLPGIDLNDYKKTIVTLEILDIILMLVPCIDCSSAVNIRTDLTEIEQEVCLSTAKFHAFITQLLDRIFHMITILSTEYSEAVSIISHSDTTDDSIQLRLSLIMSSIIHQCSPNILRNIRERIINFVTNACLSPTVRDIVPCLVRTLVKGDPIETLSCLLPRTCRSIERLLEDSESYTSLSDDKDDIELIWHLTVFADLLCARGDNLHTYKNTIMLLFHRCIPIVNKSAARAVRFAVANLLQSLCHSFPTEYRLIVQINDESFTEFLPIRAWGQTIDFDQLQARFYIPTDDDIDFACEFVDTFIYPELTLLKENGSKLSNNERLRSLMMVQSIITGCFRMVPRIESDPVVNLIPSMVSCHSKYQSYISIYSKQPQFREDLRMRIFIDIGNLLDDLTENHSVDVASINQALHILTKMSVYFGEFDDFHDLRKDFRARHKLVRNKLCDQGKTIRPLAIEMMALHLNQIEISHFGNLTHIDIEITLKIFQLSIHRYSEIRQKAQRELFCMFRLYRFSFQVIVDRLVELFDASKKTDHDQIKGCLHVLLDDRAFSLLTQYSWSTKAKLWPTIAGTTHANRISTQRLLENIQKRIVKEFATEAIVQHVNAPAIDAATTLWRPLERDERKCRDEQNQADVHSYIHLMEALSNLLTDSTLAWVQQKMALSLLILLLQKHVPIPSSCIRIYTDFLLHENSELRKYARKAIDACCRLQKFPRVYVEKTLEEVFQSMGKPVPPIDYEGCHPGDREDNRWITIDDDQLPTNQIEWEHTCFLNKPFHGYYCWPKVLKYALNRRDRYDPQQNMPEAVAILYKRFRDQDFLDQVIELMILDENEQDNNFDPINLAIFKGLFRNFGLTFMDNFMTRLYVLIREKTSEKYKGSHRIAAEIVAGMIRGSKYWSLNMLDELWEKLTPLLKEVCSSLSEQTRWYWKECFRMAMKNSDPRRMHRPIEFLLALLNDSNNINTLKETSRWYLIYSLKSYQWRIPSIWCDIQERAKELLDHPFKSVRDCIVGILSTSISFDVTLFKGISHRQPNANRLFDNICEKLHQAIEIYEKTPLMSISNEIIETDSEARRALNFIEAVVELHIDFSYTSQQPIKDATIRYFSYLCQIDNIASVESVSRRRPTVSQLCISMNYLHTQFLEGLIAQLAQIRTCSKWHARRAAIEFAQTMIFCNLFNARSFAHKLHELVLQYLFDEQFQVRVAASTTLTGFYQCGYFTVHEKDLHYFRTMSRIKCHTQIDGKNVLLPENVIKRHGGVLGLCAIVLSSPYDIPEHLPSVLILLCEHSHDPELILKSIKHCFADFRRTHHDSWLEHRTRFTECQLAVLADALFSHNYYA